MIFITHDIDWISPLHPISIAKTFTHGSKWIRFNKLFQPGIFKDHIRKLVHFNKENNVNAIWLTGAPSQHSYQKFGLRYTADCPSYKQVIDLLLHHNCEIGLHSVNTESFSKQFDTLHNLTQQPISYHRSHYLKFNEKQLFAALQQHGIKTDFSFGNARKVEIVQTPHITLGAKCTPTVLFDNAFFFNNADIIFSQFETVLNEALRTNIDVAVLFHPENFAVNPALWEYYQETLKLIRETNNTVINKNSFA